MLKYCFGYYAAITLFKDNFLDDIDNMLKLDVLVEDII